MQNIIPVELEAHFTTDKFTLIGIAGVPGSGKTYLCRQLSQKYPKIKVIPMDGYHLYRHELDENELKRRGAPFTFNYQKFKDDLIKLKQYHKGLFPSFEHSVKDPVEEQISITEEDKIIIVEGLYLFLKEWNIAELFDIKIYIDRPFNEKTVGLRHFESGIEPTLEDGIIRAINNDKLNAEYIVNNSDFKDIFVIQ